MNLGAIPDEVAPLRVSAPEGAGAAVPTWALRPAPEPNRGFREGGTVHITPPDNGAWVLRIDDEPLPRRAGVGPWAWTPAFYAGEVTAELIAPSGRAAARYLLDVAPHPDKTGREEFRGMIDAIWDVDPSLVLGSEPARTPVGTAGETSDPLVALSRLRRHAPAFVAALREVQRRPRTALRVRREELPIHRVQRVDRHSALVALRNPGVLAALEHGPAQSTTRASSPRLNAPRVETSFDSAANRCLAALALEVVRRCRHAHGQLEALVERETEEATRTALAARWPVRSAFLRDLERSLRSILLQTPFGAISRPEISVAGLNAISADPLYSRAYGCAWRALRTGIRGELADDPMWLSPTWEIYERWCFVRVAALLGDALPETSWRLRRCHPSGASHALEGETGDRRVELLLQPHFPSERPSQKHGFHSISKTRYPDLVLLEHREGESRFWVLDAKYRTSRAAVVDAMTSAHVYQDSLRLGDRRPEASVLLVPRGGNASWLEDPAFIDHHRVGVMPLVPGLDSSPNLTVLGFLAA